MKSYTLHFAICLAYWALPPPYISYNTLQLRGIYREMGVGIKPIIQIILNTFSIFWLGKNNFIDEASLYLPLQGGYPSGKNQKFNSIQLLIN